ncbi:MAG: sensor histidine kinase [Arachnia sp.]
MSGVAFLINIFAASRTNLSWKTPLALGFGGLAYLSLVRNVVESMDYTWTTSILLLIASAVSYGGGAAFRRAAHRVQTERKSGEQRLLQLQKSLARELHDSVAQTLSSAAMRANIVMSDSSLSPMAMGQLEKIADECRSSAHDLRQLLSALRDEPERTVTPGPLADVESLRNTVKAQAERLRDEGFTVDVKVDIDKLSAARCQTLAAITIEAANNIVKHARPGSTCRFSITQSTEDVCGEFTNVRKFSKVARQGFGLTGVQERLTLLDGTSEAIVKNSRWILRVSLPLGPDSTFSPALTTPASEEFFSNHRNL